MPEVGIKDEFVTPITVQSLSQLKPRWGVAIAALVYRARELGLLSERRAQQLFQTIARTWGRTSEPIDIPVEKPRAFRKMAEIVYGDPPDPRKLARDSDYPASSLPQSWERMQPAPSSSRRLHGGPSAANLVRFRRKSLDIS